MSRYASWFSTKSGRNFTRCCVGALTCAVFGNQIVVQGPFLDKLQSIIQAYNRGTPRPLPDKVNSLIEEVLHDCSLKEEEKKKLKFFYALGHEPIHAGGIDSPWGAIIGLPFIFEDIKDINFETIKIVGKETVDWIIDGQDFVKAVTFSDNAKKFAIMQQIYSCKFADVLTNATLGAGCVLLSANFARKLNIQTNAFERVSFGRRCSRYLFLYCFGFILYRLLKDPLKHISEKKADELAAETSIDYLNGGIEYYKKTLMKNIALKEMMQSKFRSPYDEHGNEKYILIPPKLPFTKRLDYLQKMRQEKLGIVEENIEFV